MKIKKIHIAIALLAAFLATQLALTVYLISNLK